MPRTCLGAVSQCLRLTHPEGMGPLAFSMEHIQPLQFTTPAEAKDARLKRQSGRGSLAGWRGTAITPTRPPTTPAPRRRSWTLLSKGPKSLIAHFASTRPPPPPVVAARVESGKAPGLFRALSTLVLNLMTDLVDTVLWALAPRANVPPNHEPLPHELWDCRDPDTPTESGL